MGEERKTTIETRTRRVYAIPIFCGVFSFCHWFVFFPLVWHFVFQHMGVGFWLYALLVFLLWLLVMAICIFCWWYDMKRIVPVSHAMKDVNTSFIYEKTAMYDGPSFRTTSSVIQPDSKTTAKVTRESEAIHMRNVALQPQNTPALYNLHTGRRSYDSEDVRQSSESFQRVTTSEVVLVKKESSLKFKSISSSDSEKSSKAKEYEALLSGDAPKREGQTVVAIVEGPSRGVEVRTKSDRRATAQEPSKVTLPSESDDNDDELFRHIDMDIRLSDERICGQYLDQRPGTRESDTPNADKLSQNMPEFDDYLHLVSVETPLSPREVFFSDLIKRASDTEQQALKAKEGTGDRRSYCVGDMTYNKVNCDDRNSVPLFLYSDEWKKEDKVQNVDPIPEQDDKQEDGGQDKPESHETALSPVETRPRSKESEDLKTLTQLLIDEEKRMACAPVIVTKMGGGEEDTATSRPSVEELDTNYTPTFPKVKPLKLTEDQDKTKDPVTLIEIVEPVIEKSRAKSRVCESQPLVFGPSRGKKRSSSEFFIADVDVDAGRLKSVTSEVYLKVEDTGMVSRLRIRDAEDKSDDDEVFEDVQSSLSKLRRHK